MKRVLLALAAGLALFLAARAIRRALASDETRIRWLVEDMAGGFDRTRMDPVLAGLAPEFQDETSGADRQELRRALAYLFFTAKDEETKRFLYRVKTEITRIEVGPADSEPRTAECEVWAYFLERRGETETLAWLIAISAHLERGDDGWRIRRTTHETKHGRRIR